MAKFLGLPGQTANSIYDILVAEVGADDTHEREAFVSRSVRDSDFSTETRIRGNLGHGGKFYRQRAIPRYLPANERGLVETWFVGCYSEDETTERREVIDRTNSALLALNIATGPRQQ